MSKLKAIKEVGRWVTIGGKRLFIRTKDAKKVASVKGRKPSKAALKAVAEAKTKRAKKKAATTKAAAGAIVGMGGVTAIEARRKDRETKKKKIKK